MLNLTYGTLPSSEQTGSVFGCLLFGGDDAVPNNAVADLPCARVAMPRLDGVPLLCETLGGGAAIRSGSFKDIAYRFDDEVLFGVIQLDETTMNATEGSALQTAAEQAYLRIFELLRAQGFPYVLRFWNYMADINGEANGLERYRQFNLGRQQAFAESGQAVSGNVPAACALGASHGPLVVAFLAGRQPSLPIENPRQVSAYDYPEQYGPRSPLFSRASVANVGNGRHLFLSGTASIVGHETLHDGDIAAQTRETLANIRAVIEEAARKTQTRCALTDLDYIVYIRREADLPVVRAIVEAELGSAVRASYLLADICRADLLVEIEGSASLPAA